jgi:outer membrane protein assembly factor BamB
MYALDMATGAVKWTYRRNGGVFTIPTVHKGKLYAGYVVPGTNTYSLVALDAADGGLTWESPISSTVDPNFLYNPSYVNGVIYINTWSSGLYAFDAASGAPKWFFNTGLSASNAAVSDGVVYVGTEGTVVTAIDAATGAYKWSFVNPGNSNGSATVYGDAVYIGSNNFMYAIHKADGTLKWKYQALGGQNNIGDNTHSMVGHFSAAVISNGILYAGSDDNLTYALDAETGAMVANYPNSMLQIRNSAPAPAVANEMVFTSREDNKLYVFDAHLTLKWLFTAAYPVSTNVCVVDADGTVYYTGDSGDQQ